MIVVLCVPVFLFALLSSLEEPTSYVAVPSSRFAACLEYTGEFFHALTAAGNLHCSFSQGGR